MHSMVIFQGYRVSYFAGNLCAQKNEVTEKASEHNGRTVFLHVSTGGVNFVFHPLSFILYSFYFLVICNNFPFCFRLRQQQSMPPLIE